MRLHSGDDSLAQNHSGTLSEIPALEISRSWRYFCVWIHLGNVRPSMQDLHLIVSSWKGGTQFWVNLSSSELPDKSNFYNIDISEKWKSEIIPLIEFESILSILSLIGNRISSNIFLFRLFSEISNISKNENIERSASVPLIWLVLRSNCWSGYLAHLDKWWINTWSSPLKLLLDRSNDFNLLAFIQNDFGILPSKEFDAME